jgi:hypothetical protein
VVNDRGDNAGDNAGGQQLRDPSAAEVIEGRGAIFNHGKIWGSLGPKLAVGKGNSPCGVTKSTYQV